MRDTSYNNYDKQYFLCMKVAHKAFLQVTLKRQTKDMRRNLLRMLDLGI